MCHYQAICDGAVETPEQVEEKKQAEYDERHEKLSSTAVAFEKVFKNASKLYQKVKFVECEETVKQNVTKLGSKLEVSKLFIQTYMHISIYIFMQL